MKKLKQNWALLPHNFRRIDSHYLVSSLWGGWVVLSEDEFLKVNQFAIRENSALFRKLKRSSLVIDESTFLGFVEKYRAQHASLFWDAGLHIAVVTEQCNFSCRYCQADATSRANQMGFEVATRVLGCLFASANQSVRLELQGGEPLLNWPTVKFLVIHARRQNKFEKKNLSISLVTNCSLLDQTKLNFLVTHGVEICTSLDGPREIHDLNRIFTSGQGTHDMVVSCLGNIRKAYRKRGIKNPFIGALPTVTRQMLEYPKLLIDEYLRLGFDVVNLRPLSSLGRAGNNWEQIGYSPDEFNAFWRDAMDYIIALNKRGIRIKEGLAAHMLTKIIGRKDPLYVDLDSPCGAGRSQLAYSPNGDVFTCDEARMLKNDMFKLGNVLHNSYGEIVKNHNLFYTSQSSLLNLWDYNSAFCAWSGTCPVLNYHEQCNPVVKITQTARYKISNFQFDYLFRNILHDKVAYRIFQSWILNKESVCLRKKVVK
ncbi:MAG TPA: radical SAM protein [Candidatus Omnitrophota bacterium]|nr:radical SAM protein [Candidatus Omnitrophota bacterium]